MPKWEYCAVIGIGRAVMGLTGNARVLNPVSPALWYFTSNGLQIVEIKGAEAQELARTMAQLGEQGWEMTGCGNISDMHHAVYFKRVKP